MAEVVLGVGMSHTTQSVTPASKWLDRTDATDPRLDYEALLRSVRPGMDEEISLERMEQRYAACQAALQKLRQDLLAATPDVMVVFGDDQHEQFLDDNMPMFSVFRGGTLPVSDRRAQREAMGGGVIEYEAWPELAEHLIPHLIRGGFDVACSNALRPEVGLGHAFTRVYRFLLPEGTIPMVPLMVNTYYPPNQPPPARCYAFGATVREAIDRWGASARVAFVASGGLSHRILDEEIDREVLDALAENDAGRLGALPAAKLQQGTSEILNWIAVGGALADKRMTLVDYVPGYRSPAGTGVGMAFASWT